MPDRDHKGWHNRGYLPHLDSPELVQHVVLRAVDSLPASLLAALPDESAARRKAIEAALALGHGARPFAAPAAARIVEDALLHFDGARYDLIAWCVMANHAHVAARWRDGYRIGDTIKGWKTFSAQAINRASGRSGAVWSRDYFDRYARDAEDVERLVAYIENNPVVAGLCSTPEAFAFSSARRRR